MTLPIVEQLRAGNELRTSDDVIMSYAALTIEELEAALEALLKTHRPGLGECCDAADLAIKALSSVRGTVVVL